MAKPSAPVFFDTNVLLYLLSEDHTKADTAEELISQGGNISVQVLNEFTQVATKKLKLPASEVRDILSTLRAILSVHPLTEAEHDAGVDLRSRYDLSVYDSMIVASALACDAKTLYSEDMQAGLVIEKRLRVRNPFKA